MIVKIVVRIGYIRKALHRPYKKIDKIQLMKFTWISLAEKSLSHEFAYVVLGLLSLQPHDRIRCIEIPDDSSAASCDQPMPVNCRDLHHNNCIRQVAVGFLFYVRISGDPIRVKIFDCI